MSDDPAGRDPGLEAFVEAIEASLRSRRGREHVLSPRDFALARGWHEAGVALATVLVAIDAAFERDPHTASLALCRRRVEELAAATPRARLAARETERASLPEVAERLDALRERLEELPGRAGALPLAELAEVSDLVAVASRPNWDYLRERLRRIDELVAGAAVEALGPQRRRGLAGGGRARGRAPPGEGRRTRARGGGRAPPAPACPRDDAPAAGVDRLLGLGREHPVPGQIHDGAAKADSLLPKPPTLDLRPGAGARRDAAARPDDAVPGNADRLRRGERAQRPAHGARAAGDAEQGCDLAVGGDTPPGDLPRRERRRARRSALPPGS